MKTLRQLRSEIRQSWKDRLDETAHPVAYTFALIGSTLMLIVCLAAC